MDVLFRNVLVLDLEAPQAVAGPTDVLVSGARIAAVGRNLEAGDGGLGEGGAADVGNGEVRVIDGHGHHLLVPGLINAHFHSPVNHMKGSLPSLPLELFMLYETPSQGAARPSPREAYLRTMLGALEMLRTGTTAVQDDAFLLPTPDPEIVDAIMRAYEDCGIRASVALDQPELPEVDKLPYLAELAPAQLRQALHAPAPATGPALLSVYDHLFDRWHGAAGGRLTAAVSISAPQRVTPEYFAALDDLSRRHHVPLFAHMLETRVQRVLATEQPRFQGRSLVEYTAELGLLSERTNVIHAIWVDDRDLDLIAQAGAVIAHNPVSNLRLGSGVMPFRAIRDRGIPVALGVDEAIAGDAVDMWGVVKTAGLIHNVTRLDSDLWPTAREVLAALWTGGAAAMLRGDELGAVRPGALADLVLLDLHTAAFTPLNDIPGQLVYCDPARSITLTMVDGRIVAEHGLVTSVDERALLDEARELFAGLEPQRRRERAGAAELFETYQAIVRRAAAVDLGLDRAVSAR
jgi:5-methylthioadenosine/S-adenosylhomocysteine deaminase